MADEDDRWFNALAGHATTPDGDDPSEKGAALRGAILSRQTPPADEVPATDPNREAALIARAQRMGLLLTQPSATKQSQGRFKSRPALWASMAAGVAALVIAVAFQLRPRPAPVTFRGSPSTIVHIRARDPQRLKRDLLSELESAGVQATGFEELGRQGIDADLPTPVPDAVAKVLAQHGIPLPVGPVLQIEIESLAPP